MLTIAYQTNRVNPRMEWFFNSLHRETGGNYDGIKIIVVDFNYGSPGRHPECKLPDCLLHTSPKPTVWQGPHRLTNRDFFAAANARNTALCLAPDGWLAYVDDLSVLMPGWLARVRAAMTDNVITFGAYMKVKKLVVSENGDVASYEPFPAGADTRLIFTKKPVAPCRGQWCYGCSAVFPVEALLVIGGWPELLCDGMGYEDCHTGIVLENAGYKMRYDTTMMTFESEEDHHVEPAFCRQDQGVSPNDKSHKVVDIANKLKCFDQFHQGGIRALRNRTLAGEPFPIPTQPATEWFTDKPLAEL